MAHAPPLVLDFGLMAPIVATYMKGNIHEVRALSEVCQATSQELSGPFLRRSVESRVNKVRDEWELFEQAITAQESEEASDHRRFSYYRKWQSVHDVELSCEAWAMGGLYGPCSSFIKEVLRHANNGQLQRKLGTLPSNIQEELCKSPNQAGVCRSHMTSS
jgi:hypothetical protein